MSRPARSAPPRDHVEVPYEGRRAATSRAYHSRDHRYGHPDPHHVRSYSGARHGVPSHRYYRSWYTHWWVHPHYRWVHTTRVVVHIGYAVDPWADAWAPPARAGWTWVPGHWAGPYWVPGQWRPMRAAPTWYGANWSWVPGFWVGGAYVEGYWRLDRRTDGQWTWEEGRYQPDGSYVPGYWRPAAAPPAGYRWEPGFWDGDDWIEGYWRPASRSGYGWVDSRYREDGTYEAGYWEPIESRQSSVWVPGWFDGETWNPGYWVTEAEYSAADPDSWTPPEGVDDGWDDAPRQPSAGAVEGEEIPLALPVDGDN